MKYIAKQIPPEAQESPFNYYSANFGIICDGNRDYISHTTREYDTIKKYIYDACGDYQNGEKITEILENYGFRKQNGKKWAPRDLHAWKLIFSENYKEIEIILKSLDLLTGGHWESKTIRGFCQSDWQRIYFNRNQYTDEQIERFEMDFFNMGEEWIVYPETDENDQTEIYTYDNPRAEIASAFGINENDITLCIFDGYEKIVKYKMMEV